jgi:malonyl-CoA O-methyltransferase
LPGLGSSPSRCRRARERFARRVSTVSIDAVLPAAAAIGPVFARASRSFDSARFVHDETRKRLLERCQLVRLDPRTTVDLGCATGAGAAALAGLYPQARVVAIDASLQMLGAARGVAVHCPSIARVAGDAARVPLPAGSVQLLLANFVLPWCRPEAVFAEARRVLERGGLLLFATLGPDSLTEVRQAWAAVDDRIHVHGFFDMHDLADMAVAQGLEEVVVDVDRIAVTYADTRGLVTDLRACGGVNIAAGRRHALTGKRRWQGFEKALAAGRNRVSVTLELILGQAWGGGIAAQRRGSGEFAVAVDRIGRRGGRTKGLSSAVQSRWKAARRLPTPGQE